MATSRSLVVMYHPVNLWSAAVFPVKANQEPRATSSRSYAHEQRRGAKRQATPKFGLDSLKIKRPWRRQAEVVATDKPSESKPQTNVKTKTVSHEAAKPINVPPQSQQSPAPGTAQEVLRRTSLSRLEAPIPTFLRSWSRLAYRIKLFQYRLGMSKVLPFPDSRILAVPLTGRNHPVPISQVKDKWICDHHFESTRQQYSRVILPQSNPRFRTLQRVLDRLKVSTSVVPDDVELFLIDRDRLPGKEASGFTTGGNKIFINTSLFNDAKSDSQVAFILCHELAHCLAHHKLERFEVLDLLDQPNGTMLDFRLRRLQEFEADDIGNQLTDLAGYPPGAALAWMERVSSRRSVDTTPKEYRAHPEMSERIRALKFGGEKIDGMMRAACR